MKRILVSAFLFTLIAATVNADGYSVPQRTDSNLIVASYNIKWFGQSKHDLQKLAQVIQYFDVCGILEVKDEGVIRLLVDQLNHLTAKRWGYSYGVRTRRPKGSYYETYAVVWRTDRVVIGNGIISNIWDVDETYRNDPYIVSFYSGRFDFIFMLVHTRWESDEEGSRSEEVKHLAEQVSFLEGFLDERDIILAGDFNYSGNVDVIKEFELASSFSQIDPNLQSTFKNDYTGYNESYDHIFINGMHTIEFNGESGVLDSTALVFGDNSAENMKKSKEELSDHLPVWAIFNTTTPDDD